MNKGRSIGAAFFCGKFIMGIIGVISVICIIGIIIKKVARQKSGNLICESVDKMWNFKACEIRENSKK